VRENRRRSSICRLRVHRCCEHLLTRPRPPNLSPWDQRDKQVSATFGERRCHDPSSFTFRFSHSARHEQISRNDLLPSIARGAIVRSFGLLISISIMQITFAKIKMMCEILARIKKKTLEVLPQQKQTFPLFHDMS